VLHPGIICKLKDGAGGKSVEQPGKVYVLISIESLQLSKEEQGWIDQLQKEADGNSA